MAIKIGTAKTLRCDNWQIIPDDRQQTIEVFNGVIVQDFGHVEAGDKISCTIILSSFDFNIVKNYWNTRTLVTVIDDAGLAIENVRVVIKNYKYVDRFPNFFEAGIELWRV